MEPWHESLKNSMEILTGMCKKVHNYDKWEREGLKTEENPLVPYNVTEKFELRTWTAEDGLSTGKEPEEEKVVIVPRKIIRTDVLMNRSYEINSREDIDRYVEELKAKTAAELNEELVAAKKELFNLRFQNATNQLDNTSRIKEVRKNIARIQTVITEKARVAN